MEYIVLFVILARIIVPLAIVRWPLWGAIAAFIADALDYIIFDLTVGIPSNYQQMDKLLDIYYLSIAFSVSLRWMKLARITASILFIYRLIGTALFLTTQTHLFLFIFPNVFEFFFIFEAARQKFFPKFELSLKKVIVVVLIILLPKLLNEYIINVIGLDPWTWLKNNILWFLK